MALSPLAYLPAGCSPQCPRNVVARENVFAYCSVQSVSLYTVSTRNVPGVLSDAQMQALAQNPGQPQQAAPVPVTSYPMKSVFGYGIGGPITAFDYNDEFLACLCTQSKSVQMYRIADVEPITAKLIPKSLLEMFRREGTPTTMRLAGKYHLLFGTSNGRLISLNTNESHEPRCIAVPGPHQQLGAVEGVECMAVSPSRADTVAAGTTDGTLCLLNLSASQGLRPNLSLYPFPPPAKDKEKSATLTPSPACVSVMAFDPNNTQYLAVGSVEGHLALVDVNAQQVVQVFEWKESFKDTDEIFPVSSITWSASESGVFFTSSIKSNVVKKWNVGSKTMIGSFSPQLPPTGIRCVSVLDKDRIVLTSTDGGVKVFSISQLRVDFMIEAGHTDVGSQCVVSPSDRDVAASCGSDGSIRVWSLRKMSLSYTIDVGPVMVYSLDWSPNGKHIIAALGSGELVQYHCSTRKEGWRASIFSDMIYKIKWSVADSGVAAAVSRNGVAVVSTKDGKVLKRYTTRQPCLGVDIEPVKGKLLAAACYDHKIYIYNLSSSSSGPQYVLAGHTDACVDISFNPAVPQFLLSGSYDGTARIWDLSPGDDHSISVHSRVLKGHADRVKSVVWCSLAPYLCLTGSSDATIRVWDIRNGVSVTTVRGHNADVNSISSHVDRPLVFISSSKDATMVVWHLTLLRQVYLDAALGSLEQCIVADPSSLMAVSTTGVSVSVVSGNAVQMLCQELRECQKPNERMEKLINFFDFPCGTLDISEMTNFISDPQNASVSSKGLVVPPTKLVEISTLKAKKMNERAHGKTVTGAGKEYQKERLLEASNELLRCGQLEDYCAIMMEAGEWDRAIAMAPALSREYWRAVCLRAAETMEINGDFDKAINYYIFAEEANRAAQLYLRQSISNADAAAVLSRTCPQRNPDAGQVQEPQHNTAIDQNGATTVSQEIALERSTKALERHRNPRLYAAVQIANGNCDEAVRLLYYTGDVCVAHLLAHTAPMREQSSIDTVYFMSMLQSARQHKWDTAIMCAARQSNPYHSFGTLVGYFQYTQAKQLKSSLPPSQSMMSITPGNFGTISEKLKGFYEKIMQEISRLQLPLDPGNIQQRHANDGLASQNQLAAMVIQSDPQVGPTTTSNLLQSFSGFVESLLAASLQDINSPNCVFYLKQAFNVTGYVAFPLVSASNQGGMAAEQRKFLSLVYMIASLMSVKVYRFPKLLNFAFTKSREMAVGDRGAEDLINKMQNALGSYGPASIEVDCTPLGSTVPALSSEGKQIISIFSNESVCGALHLLEDGTSFISREEALSWTLVCHFSPLGTGARLSVL